MKRWPSARLRTASLVIVNLALLSGVVQLWRRGERQVQEPAQVRVVSLRAPDLSLLTLSPPKAVDIGAIRDAAVFHTRRAFYTPPPPSQSLPPPDYTLAGIMGLSKDRRVAFLKKNADHSSRTVHLGDDLDGWRVESIDLQRLLLVHDTQHAEIKSTLAAPTLGLLRGPAVTRAAHVAPRSLGGGSLASSEYATAVPDNDARPYRPPPQ